MTKPMTYADAGVDIAKADRFVEQIREMAKSTFNSRVIGGIGGFGGLYSLNLQNIANPVLVSSTDGVGTKLKIAFMTKTHDTVGIDLVAMCVNDIAVLGAKPLFFLDYLAMGALAPKIAADLVQGIVTGCREAQCVLLGGETAEMPDFYRPNEYDLAGFAVGIVDNRRVIDGSDIGVGDRVVGIASSGLHANGFSLVRKICFEVLRLGVTDMVPPLEKPLGEVLLTPTRIYVKTLQTLIKDSPIHGLAHITGGGIVGNLPRILPEPFGVLLYKDSWEVPPVFSFLQEAGGISDEEMLKTFNNGIGMAAVVPEEAVQGVLERLKGLKEKGCVIGEIVKRPEDGSKILWK
ncbi:MAG: phosphoribosylformylglycinamidine cyclo-ligase [Deltaproteobacteria bacterium]|nr:phosphoribosylformylglycinamidine cyclo-ligase [Deltaproteobacteria bacterium]MBW2041249.1 phosphoribosylformylglycinamidine cyclo-ligase [Deltaproteobacteria bacterium]MBW2132947.1 phosphoribosylformylglycinamidine cyclo-ligase [Deltaproteobacteria bacterium]